MKILSDREGRNVRLTEERRRHILEHPEMRGQFSKVAETLRKPDSVLRSLHDANERHYYKFFEKTPVTRKFLLVAVEYKDEDAFVITSFFVNKLRGGKSLWPL